MLTFNFLIWLHKNWPRHFLNFTILCKNIITFFFIFFNIIFLKKSLNTISDSRVPITPCLPDPVFSLYASLSLSLTVCSCHLSLSLSRSLPRSATESLSRSCLGLPLSAGLLPQIPSLSSISADLSSQIPLYLNCLSSLLTTLELINCPLFKLISWIHTMAKWIIGLLNWVSYGSNWGWSFNL